MKNVRLLVGMAALLGMGSDAFTSSALAQDSAPGTLLGEVTFQTLFTNRTDGIGPVFGRPRISPDGRRIWTSGKPDPNLGSRYGFRIRNDKHEPFGPLTMIPEGNHNINLGELVGMNGDGSKVAINRTGFSDDCLVWTDGVPNPVQEVRDFQSMALSADGRYLFGLHTPSGSRGNIVRVDLLTSDRRTIATNITWQPGIRRGLASSDGSRFADIDGNFLWTAEDGVRHPFPAGFLPNCMDATGRFLGGNRIASNIPAIADFRDGNFTTISSNGIGNGSFDQMSADGSVKLFSRIDPSGPVFVVIAPDGLRYRLDALVPDLAGLFQSSSPRMSADGRTLVGIGRRIVTDASGVATAFDIGWVADLVLPEDGPRLARRLNASRRLELGIPTRRGYGYQVERSTILDPNAGSPTSWVPVGSEVTGDGGTVWMEPDSPADSGFYRVQAIPRAGSNRSEPDR